MDDSYLLIDYIYLDSEERKRFAQASHEYLIEQLQFTGAEALSTTANKFRLNFNHPSKFLLWAPHLTKFRGGRFLAHADDGDWEAARERFAKLTWLAEQGSSVNETSNPTTVTLDSGNHITGQFLFNESGASTATVDNVILLVNEADAADMSVESDDEVNGVVVHDHFNYGRYVDGTANPVTSGKLQLNGHDRFQERDGNYFNYVQPHQHFSNTPADGINVYSFALKPEEHQPSGTCNFSRIDNATLNVTIANKNELGDDSTLNIYTVNYNVLRVMSGMAGTAYSN